MLVCSCGSLTNQYNLSQSRNTPHGQNLAGDARENSLKFLKTVKTKWGVNP